MISLLLFLVSFVVERTKSVEMYTDRMVGPGSNGYDGGSKGAPLVIIQGFHKANCVVIRVPIDKNCTSHFNSNSGENIKL